LYRVYPGSHALQILDTLLKLEQFDGIGMQLKPTKYSF
jgi:hypothetical protein